MKFLLECPDSIRTGENENGTCILCDFITIQGADHGGITTDGHYMTKAVRRIIVGIRRQQCRLILPTVITRVFGSSLIISDIDEGGPLVGVGIIPSR